MTYTNIFTILGTVAGVVAAICFVPLLAFVVFPFINGLSPEKRLEKFIDKKCLEGNEVAIRIRREGLRYCRDTDYRLIRGAIEGNKYAIKALKLEFEETNKCKM
jgi:hypothetical protein